MDYLRYKVDTKKLGLKESCVRIYPLVCMHVGSTRCDMTFIKQQLKRIAADPNGRWVYLGDAGECATKLSKGNVYKQLLSPQQQQDVVVELLTPLKDKGILGARGNHGNRIDRESGLSFDATLCQRLGLPYVGTCAFLNLVVNRSSYDLFFHHGADSGTPLATKIRKAEDFAKFIDADALFTAHSHVAVDLQPAALMRCNNDTCEVETKLRNQYICGSAYDSRGDYAEEKGYPPILPAYISVEFDGRIVEGRAQYSQKCQIFRSSGKHKMDYAYIYREDK